MVTPLTDSQFNKVIEKCTTVSPEWMKNLKLIPSQYTQYYFHTRERISQLKEQDKTRGESILELEKQIFREYADENNSEKPLSLAKRGGGGYSKIAVGVMEAIYNDTGKWMVINVANNGTVRFLDDDAVIETACFVSKNGIQPINILEYPKSIVGLVAAVKNYESLAVEAALTGNKDIALQALIAHPLIGDYDVAKALLDEMLEAHKDFLPQFNNGK
ncbi:MAG: hypothetical protein ACK5LC_00035 [Coprobacillaceae bacterium]